MEQSLLLVGCHLPKGICRAHTILIMWLLPPAVSNAVAIQDIMYSMFWQVSASIPGALQWSYVLWLHAMAGHRTESEST